MMNVLFAIFRHFLSISLGNTGKDPQALSALIVVLSLWALTHFLQQMNRVVSSHVHVSQWVMFSESTLHSTSWCLETFVSTRFYVSKKGKCTTISGYCLLFLWFLWWNADQLKISTLFWCKWHLNLCVVVFSATHFYSIAYGSPSSATE